MGMHPRFVIVVACQGWSWAVGPDAKWQNVSSLHLEWWTHESLLSYPLALFQNTIENETCFLMGQGLRVAAFMAWTHWTEGGSCLEGQRPQLLSGLESSHRPWALGSSPVLQWPGSWGRGKPTRRTPRSSRLASSPLLTFSPESSLSILGGASAQQPRQPFWKFLWKPLGYLECHPRTCVCTHVCPGLSRLSLGVRVGAGGCGRAWVLSLPSSADPDRGGLERGDVPWDRIARWSQQRHVLVRVLHCPDAVWELYPLWAGWGGRCLLGPSPPPPPRWGRKGGLPERRGLWAWGQLFVLLSL